VNDLGAAFGVIGVIVTLLVLGAGGWVIVRGSAKDAREKRQAAFIEELTGRLDYVEPRLKKAEEQNAILMTLHNPTAKLDDLSASDARILEILSDQGRLLAEIDVKISQRNRGEG
jgi:hypothetical protein